MVRSKSGPTYRPPLLEHFEFCNPNGLSRFVELAVHLDVMSLMLSDCVRIGDGVDLAALIGHDYKLGALGHVLLVPWAAHSESEIHPFTVADFCMECSISSCFISCATTARLIDTIIAASKNNLFILIRVSFLPRHQASCFLGRLHP